MDAMLQGKAEWRYHFVFNSLLNGFTQVVFFPVSSMLAAILRDFRVAMKF